MTDDNHSTCQASESCPDAACDWHRFDLYAALVGVADAWMGSLETADPTTTRRAFLAVAELAAVEVLP